MTDDDGVATTTTAPLTIIAPVVDILVANDTFTRTVSPGWGTADQGGAWTSSAGAGSVNGTQGVSAIAAVNGSFSARLTGVTGTDLVTRFSTTVDKRPAGSGGAILSRGRITPSGEYRLKVSLKSNGTATANFVRTNTAGTETALTTAVTIPGFTYSAGSVIRTALKVSGGTPTTLSAKVWIGTEPADWQYTTTDSTAGLQDAGHTGMAVVLSSTATNVPITFRTDDYSVLSVGTAAPPETQIPPDDPTPTLPPAQTGTPKNIIHLIGDGMGFNTVDLGSVFQSGKTLYQQKITNGPNLTKIGGQGATQPYQYFSVQAAASNFPAGGSYSPTGAWSTFTQPLSGTTDSAASATALSSGLKTNNEVIGKDATGKDIRSIAELAQDVDKATGVVTTKYLSDATPAAYLTHDEDRGNYTQIADEIVASNANVVFGAGNPLYDNDANLRGTPDYTYISQPTWDKLTTGQTPYTFVDSAAEFDALATGETPEQVFGVAHAFTTLQASRSALAPASVPFSTTRNADVPTLAQMSKAALNVLDQDPDGFFVMIEGGAIDSAAHANNTAGVVEEQVDFNDAVQAVVDWVEASSSWDETLVIVTADHETGYLWGPGSNPVRNPIVGTAGTAPAVQWNTVNHSNQLVPFYAMGVGSAALAAKATGTDPVRGAYLDNADVGAASLAFWGGLPGDAPTVHVPPPPPPLATDTFERTVVGSWGTADVGRRVALHRERHQRRLGHGCDDPLGRRRHDERPAARHRQHVPPADRHVLAGQASGGVRRLGAAPRSHDRRGRRLPAAARPLLGRLHLGAPVPHQRGRHRDGDRHRRDRHRGDVHRRHAAHRGARGRRDVPDHHPRQGLARHRHGTRRLADHRDRHHGRTPGTRLHRARRDPVQHRHQRPRHRAVRRLRRHDRPVIPRPRGVPARSAKESSMRAAQRLWWRRAVGIAAAAALVGVGLVTVPTAATAAPQVWADPTVTADALPTVQIDGVVWSQVVVGNTVYVAGDFTTARPAGAAAGVDTTPRSNLLAYNLTTGALITTWAPSLNAPAYSIAASPDGTRIYVGGDFTRVNNVARNRFAVDQRDVGRPEHHVHRRRERCRCARSSRRPRPCTSAGPSTPSRASPGRGVAAFNASTGAVTTWRVSVQPRQVDAIVLNSSGSQLYIGGRFDFINGVARQGIGAAATSNGATIPVDGEPRHLRLRVRRRDHQPGHRRHQRLRHVVRTHQRPGQRGQPRGHVRGGRRHGRPDLGGRLPRRLVLGVRQPGQGPRLPRRPPAQLRQLRRLPGDQPAPPPVHGRGVQGGLRRGPAQHAGRLLLARGAPGTRAPHLLADLLHRARSPARARRRGT